MDLQFFSNAKTHFLKLCSISQNPKHKCTTTFPSAQTSNFHVKTNLFTQILYLNKLCLQTSHKIHQIQKHTTKQPLHTGEINKKNTSVTVQPITVRNNGACDFSPKQPVLKKRSDVITYTL